jgi:hypothetical protein
MKWRSRNWSDKVVPLGKEGGQQKNIRKWLRISIGPKKGQFLSFFLQVQDTLSPLFQAGVCPIFPHGSLTLSLSSPDSHPLPHWSSQGSSLSNQFSTQYFMHGCHLHTHCHENLKSHTVNDLSRVQHPSRISTHSSITTIRLCFVQLQCNQDSPTHICYQS